MTLRSSFGPRFGPRLQTDEQASYARVGHTSESSLFAGYRGVRETDDVGVETRPCACGGSVKADPGDPAKGVAAHRFTSRHRAWRANQVALGELIDLEGD